MNVFLSCIATILVLFSSMNARADTVVNYTCVAVSDQALIQEFQFKTSYNYLDDNLLAVGAKYQININDNLDDLSIVDFHGKLIKGKRLDRVTKKLQKLFPLKKTGPAVLVYGSDLLSTDRDDAYVVIPQIDFDLNKITLKINYISKSDGDFDERYDSFVYSCKK